MNLDSNKGCANKGSQLVFYQHWFTFHFIRSANSYHCKQNSPIIPPNLFNDPMTYRKPYSHHDDSEAYQYCIGCIDASTLIYSTNRWRSRRRGIHWGKEITNKNLELSHHLVQEGRKRKKSCKSRLQVTYLNESIVWCCTSKDQHVHETVTSFH